MAKIDVALKNLVNLTNKKIKHLKDILDITQKQKEVIAEQNIDMLTKYVKEKQGYIDIIDGLDEEFQKIYKSIRSKLQINESGHETAMSAGEAGLYRELKEKVREAQNIIRVIFRLEKENNKNAEHIMENVKGKIRAINVGQKGYKAYKSSPTMTDGVYLDKKR